MINSRRSASVGALPREKKHYVSRNESASGISLDVRCACQYFQCDSLLPDRVNPVDSRPSSKLDFHEGLEHEQYLQQQHVADTMLQQQQHQQPYKQQQQTFQPMNQHIDQLSVHSLNVGVTNSTTDRYHMEMDRISVRSTAQVDVSFVEKYPELEETARSRGLIVRSISDATDGMPDAGVGGGSSMFLAGNRRRQMSVSGMSTGSGMRDPETMSMRSVTSLRRISRSPSKADLFVADINIPVARTERREGRSVSGSRRTSNIDLSHFASHSQLHYAPIMMQTEQHAQPAQTVRQNALAPSFNLIAPTPMPTAIDMPPDFSHTITTPGTFSPRAISPTRAASPAKDFRNAKPPMSTDYMRPDENKENVPYYVATGDIMPQNKPIDVSKYNTDLLDPDATTAYQNTAQNINLGIMNRVSRAVSPTKGISPTRAVSPIRAASPMRAASPLRTISATRAVPPDPLQQTVAELEEIRATRNLVDISDNIKVETEKPPSLAGDIESASLHLGEETAINIVRSLALIDPDALVRNEFEKALEARQISKQKRAQSPLNKRSQSPLSMQKDTLQLPTVVPTQSSLKRQRTPERQMSPTEPSKKYSNNEQVLRTQPLELPSATISGAIHLEEASPEAKSTYASRFKSMFSTKNNDAAREVSPKRTPSPKRERSLSPKHEKSPSPLPSKLMNVFSKSKPTPIEIVSGSNAVIKNKKGENEPLSVKVTETFSLKVDEMDQYSSRPAKTVASTFPTTPARSLYSSRDDFSMVISEQDASLDVNEAFTPIVLSSANRAQFLAGNRTLYSSEIDIQSRRSESEIRDSSKDASMLHISQMSQISQINTPKGTLISMPINIGSSGNIPYGSSMMSSSQSGYMRAPSEQRGLKQGLTRKSSFVSSRTQSQDRHRITGSQDDIYGTRITKTVSFNFDERKSRLSEFENSTISQQQKEQRDFLERTYFSRDHEYEPIGVPSAEDKPSILKKESSPQPLNKSMDMEEIQRDGMKEAENLQRDLEERYFNSEITPRSESRTEYEMETSQIDLSALEEPPLKPEKKGFMASAQDRTRKMQAGFKNQAGKLRTKLKTPTKKPPSSSPKAKERKRFKAPEFSKMKMPEIKRPDMLKDFKRPEFTKFNKPDMSKFKIPEKFSTLKLRRSKSFKENETPQDDEMSGVTAEPGAAAEHQPHKKMFEFNFGTYPRAFRKKKPAPPVKEQSSFGTDTGTEGLSMIPSTETQPSVESSSSPQGDRGPGPVRSRWADKFSDVSYNDSEGSRYRRYGSEQESFDRESSLERRMKDDLEETGSEANDLGILAVSDAHQFTEFDEENRAIHEISNLRAGEFKRRPMVHQDSDLRSEDSKEAVGWTDKEVLKNKLLRKAELDAEASYLKNDNQSVASSGKKVVMEEIDDDEFFLRKRGISEDNIELRQYISDAIREGYDMPLNSLAHVGRTNEPLDYADYDVPPPKPSRLHKSYQPENISQEFEQRSEYGDDLSMSQNGSDYFGAPKKPLRKARSRSKYSVDSQDQPVSREQYFDDDEDYLRPPHTYSYKEDEIKMNNLDFPIKEYPPDDEVNDAASNRPLAPRRRKRQLRETSMDKDSYVNGFSGRSISNSYLQPTDDVIVYRTEHEYPIPLATPENYTDGASASSRKSRSISRFDEDDSTSRGAQSLGLDNNLRTEYDDDDAGEQQGKYVIDMLENDGYAVVRKEQVPRPTPPARRKKFSRSPVERYNTLPNMPTPPPARPPPPRGYKPSSDQQVSSSQRRSLNGLEVSQNYEDDYEEPANALNEERAESPRNLQSGEIINKMKYRPLPAPPRPPRDKRQRAESKGSYADDRLDEEHLDVDSAAENLATSSTAESYDQTEESDAERRFVEVEVSTQTDPLPDDFICEEFEITDDMKVIEPRRPAKTLDELLREQESNDNAATQQLTEEEQLTRGLQRFREANQRSLSEKSRNSSQVSRPQTPSSAVIIERRISTPVQSESMLEASLIVRPIDDLDLEEEALRREGLLTDSSQHSKSDAESRYQGEEEESVKLAGSDYSYEHSSEDLDAAVEKLRARIESEREDREVERTMRDYSFKEEQEQETESEHAERFSDHYDEDEVENKVAVTEKSEDIQDKEDIEDIEEPIIAEVAKHINEAETETSETALNDTQFDELDEPVPAPLPPPRRKSMPSIETAATNMTIAEQQPQLVATVQSMLESERQQSQLPARMADLEVERLRVHALQAGQIMVSQLHGAHISSDELECQSGNLVVKNIELPAGFIEDIVERVRSTERNNLLSAETQTSLQASSEKLPSPTREAVPPPKPPRLRDLQSDQQPQTNLDEQTQTDAAANLPPAYYPTAEYLQSLAPLAFYNLRARAVGAEEDAAQAAGDIDSDTCCHHHRHSRHHHHHHHHRRRSASSSDLDEKYAADDLSSRARSRRRSRSATQPAYDSDAEKETQSVTVAGRRFITACSLSLVHIINNFTNIVRGAVDKNHDTDGRMRNVTTLVVLFAVVTLGLLIFLLSGRSVHTHHWDYFNPPGNSGRTS